MTDAPQPTSSRLDWLDALRGFALFGILWVNLTFFSGPDLQLQQADWNLWSSPGDVWAERLRIWLIEGKFYPIFALLFGWGLGLMLARGVATALLVRRLVILALVGLSHAVLLSSGDILVAYALLGGLVLLFRDLPAHTGPGWAVGLIGVSTLLMGGTAALFALGGLDPHAALDYGLMQAESRVDAELHLAVFQEGTWGEMVRLRLLDYALFWQGWFFWGPICLAMMLVGLWASRLGSLLPFRPIWLVMALLGNLLVVACLEAGQQTANPSLDTLALALLAVFGPLQAMTMVAAFQRLPKRRWGQALVKWLAPCGRMSLTHYVAQSAVCTLLFAGFRLYGQVGPLGQLAIALLNFSAQVAISHWWLGRFRQGPLERLWRSWTYRS